MGLAIQNTLYAAATGRVLQHIGPLTNGLVSYWALNEASGNALDSHGTNTLTDTNTVTTAVAGGPDGADARQFTVASSEYFTVTDNATLESGAGSQHWAIWVYADSLTATRNIIGKRTGGNEYVLAVLITTGVAQLTSWHGTVSKATPSNGSAVSAGAWAFVSAYYDARIGQIGASVNGGAYAVLSTGGAPLDTTSTVFQIGANGASSAHFDGRLTKAALWKNRVLTQAEVVYLYNGGVGRVYADLAAAVG